MIRTQVYLPEELYYEAKLEAKSSGQSISVLLRDGLQTSLNERKSKKEKRINLADAMGALSFSKTPTNAAETHNDIYDL